MKLCRAFASLACVQALVLADEMGATVGSTGAASVTASSDDSIITVELRMMDITAVGTVDLSQYQRFLTPSTTTVDSTVTLTMTSTVVSTVSATVTTGSPSLPGPPPSSSSSSSSSSFSSSSLADSWLSLTQAATTTTTLTTDPASPISESQATTGSFTSSLTSQSDGGPLASTFETQSAGDVFTSDVIESSPDVGTFISAFESGLGSTSMGVVTTASVGSNPTPPTSQATPAEFWTSTERPTGPTATQDLDTTKLETTDIIRFSPSLTTAAGTVTGASVCWNSGGSGFPSGGASASGRLAGLLEGTGWNNCSRQNETWTWPTSALAVQPLSHDSAGSRLGLSRLKLVLGTVLLLSGGSWMG